MAVEARRFTLLNVVVVLLVLLFGLVLIMYYVARVKQNSLRESTAARMVAIYKSLEVYQTRQGFFPGYRVLQAETAAGQATPASWAFAILPYFENEETAIIYAKYGPDAPPQTRGQQPTERLPLFLATGSDRDSGPALSFVVNTGLPDGQATPQVPADWPANGICHDLFPARVDGEQVATSRVSAAFIQNHDGLDATLLLAENTAAGNWTDTEEPQVGFVWLPTLNPPPVARVNGRAPALSSVENPYHLARPSSRFPTTATVLYASGKREFMSSDIDYLVYMRLMCPADALAAPAGANPGYQLPSELTPLPEGPAPEASPLE